MGERALSVCVSTRDRPDGLARLINALAQEAEAARHGWPDVELIVTFDGCAPYARESLARFPGATKVKVNRTSRGFAWNRNDAVDVSAAELVGFLDDDAVPSPVWLASAARGAATYRDALAFGGRVRRLRNQTSVGALLRDEVYYRETFGTWYTEPESIACIGTAFEVVDLPGPPYVNGGNSVYRRTTFDQFGSFRTDLPAYIDVEFGLRFDARRHAVLLAGMSIEHAHASSLREYLDRCLRSGRARRQLSKHPAHARRAVVRSVGSNLAIGNFRRARRLSGQRGRAVALLTAQELTHLYGYLRR